MIDVQFHRKTSSEVTLRLVNLFLLVSFDSGVSFYTVVVYKPQRRT